MKKVTTVFTFFLALNLLHSQSAPISIDGRFDDWADIAVIEDTPESTFNVEIEEFQVSNDDQFLFIKVVFDKEINLKEDDPYPHEIYLDIDTDNDPSTGYSAQTGYGAELSIDFSARQAYFNLPSGSSTIQFSDFQMRISPTITSNTFEIAIGRGSVPDGTNVLFSSSTIRLLWRNESNGDALPNIGDIFSYTFDETPVPEIDRIDINKDNPDFVRIVAYNTLFNGLTQPDQVDHLGNIVKALQPDIIGFSECWDTDISLVASLMNNWIPLPDGQEWSVLKYEDLITASRWPVSAYWTSLNRQFPVLIDLPDNRYGTDLLFTNVHLRCCTANTERQQQVDAYAAFILDAKAEGGNVTIPQNTPIVYGGDLNLVGYAQQLTTLLTGDIQGVQLFGPGGPLDWDETDLTDEICRQTDKRMSYTWRNDSSSFPPGRLDFLIYSDAVMNAEKSFTLQTEVMPLDRLASYNLSSNDSSSASDHFPVTVDFSIDQTLANSEPVIELNSIYPNPVEDRLTIVFSQKDQYFISLTDALGRIVFTKNIDGIETSLGLSKLTPAVYFLNIQAKDGGVYQSKVLVVRE